MARGGQIPMHSTASNPAPENPMAISGLGQISIIAHDLPRATAFYRDVLGLPLLFTADQLAFFDCRGVRLMLGPASAGARPSELHSLFPRPGCGRRSPASGPKGRRDRSSSTPGRSHGQLRPVDGWLPRLGGQHHAVDERGSALLLAIPRGPGLPRKSRYP